jgi:EAL domain-containing protein (putative c-di-GMP-specific phosphodiesterase class I)
VHDPQRGAATTQGYALSLAVPDALSRGEFVVAYQPMFNLADGRLVGVEALVRWQHPTLGLLPPGRFIDAAERTGVIVPLGLHVLRQACTQAAEWQTLHPARPLVVSVNVAAAQLQQPGLPAAVADVLTHTGLPAHLLQLEITENVLLEPDILGSIDELTRLGVKIALDDFGTGYCRLADLHNLPVHTIKTAASLVEFLRARHTADPVEQAILTAIIDLSHALGVSVTAEGIEHPIQQQRLTELGADTGQGFHLGRPQPPQQITHLLHDTTPR